MSGKHDVPEEAYTSVNMGQISALGFSSTRYVTCFSTLIIVIIHCYKMTKAPRL